ncbi:hypothetical protein LIER_34773 [Lithospermum erythrorhizon]|uniref:Uncharacterized protein n=1 Tax=Lithospermum erythrorhizon TaxID=34254 RepID=A0AAV3S371_LITER
MYHNSYVIEYINQESIHGYGHESLVKYLCDIVTIQYGTPTEMSPSSPMALPFSLLPPTSETNHKPPSNTNQDHLLHTTATPFPTPPVLATTGPRSTPHHPMVLRPNPRPTFKLAVTQPHALNIQVQESEKSCFTQANKCPLWRKSMDEDINSMLHTNTWSLIPPDPSMNVVGCR